jgi:hypothetical protein
MDMAAAAASPLCEEDDQEGFGAHKDQRCNLNLVVSDSQHKELQGKGRGARRRGGCWEGGQGGTHELAESEPCRGCGCPRRLRPLISAHLRSAASRIALCRAWGSE